MDYGGITPMDNLTGTKTYISLKNHHTWGCQFYVFDSRLQGNIYGLTKWEPHSRVGIYIGHSPFHGGLVALVLNPETCHVSTQFHVMFDDEFFAVPFMREGTIPPTFDRYYAMQLTKWCTREY